MPLARSFDENDFECASKITQFVGVLCRAVHIFLTRLILIVKLLNGIHVVSDFTLLKFDSRLDHVEEGLNEVKENQRSALDQLHIDHVVGAKLADLLST